MKKFNELPNTAVITTKYVLNNKSPILYVYHYDDGTWQFSGKETNLKNEDYRVLSLEEIIDMDPTVLDVANLPNQMQAYRESTNSEWTIKEIE